MNIAVIIDQLLSNQDLTANSMCSIMRAIMTGKCTDSQIAGFLIALRAKGETVTEITAAAEIMRELSTKVAITGNNLVDIVGTGGDAQGTFNVSTATSLVVAAAGGIVAKHGSRSISSNSGSADLLEAAGVNLNLDSTQIAHCINQIGIGFMFAPQHHSAMKYCVTARKEMAVRTMFNLLGPLTNPAGVKRQLTGVFAKQWVIPLAEVLANLGSEQAMIVHSEDGLDEISITAPTFIAELKQCEITSQTISPEKYGFKSAALEDIKVDNPQQSLAMILKAFNNQPSPAHDMICLNAGAAIYVAGISPTIEHGIDLAKAVLADGSALDKLNQLKTLSQTI